MDIEEMKGLSAYELSSFADCGSPDSLESAGAKMLVSVRNSVVEAIVGGGVRLDDLNNWGQLSEIADNAPDTYTHQRWLQFVDLCAYNEEPECDEWTGDLTQIAGQALYQIADRLAHALAEDWRDGWECGGCGSDADESPDCYEGCKYPEDSEERDDEDTPASDPETPVGAGAEVTEDSGIPEPVKAAEAVLTGPVDLPVSDPLLNLLIQAETDSDIRRMDSLRAGHEQAVRADRIKVWTWAAVLAVLGVVLTVAGFLIF